MGEYRVTGIVISAIDYKEKDKLVTLYTLQLGKISAVIRGVKNKNAKLKYAAQPFNFGEYMLVKKGEYYTIVSCEQTDSFYDLTANYGRFLAGQVALEVTGIIMQPGMINEKYFVLLLKTLKMLCYESVNENVVLVKFLISMFALSGYDWNFSVCSECGSALKGEAFLNLDAGSLSCRACASSYSFEFSKKQFSLLKILHNSTFEQLHSIKCEPNDFSEILVVLGKNFENKFNRKIKVLVNFY